jgi:GNAT superfamily N-acetyltransferase
MIYIRRNTSDNKDFQELVRQLDNELNKRYGILQAQYNKYNKIEALDTVVLAYIDNNPVACGCFKVFDKKTVEIKRMVVKPEFRGTGIAKMVLLEIEKWAIERGYSRSVLETGIRQPEAIRFYTKLGYSTIENYGQYIGEKNSICMSKKLRI